MRCCKNLLSLSNFEDGQPRRKCINEPKHVAESNDVHRKKLTDLTLFLYNVTKQWFGISHRTERF
jgi:hypothetical protein